MAAARPPAQAQSAEQLRYARWLDLGTRVGLVVLALTFAAYVGGIATPLVAHEKLPALWGLPVNAFIDATGAPTGWGWLRLAHRGDMTNLLGIVLLSGCSMLCLLAVMPLYARRGDRAYLLMCLAEVAVLLLAASGVLTAGH